jgi:hypothetical protein
MALVTGVGEGSSSKGLIIVGVLVVVTAVGIYFQFSRSMGQDEADQMPDSSRLRRMAIIWYALSIVLSVSFVQRPAALLWDGWGSQMSLVDGVVGAVGAVFMVVAVWRLVVVVSFRPV